MTMQFEHEVHEETYRRIREYLPEFFEDLYHDEEDGHVYVRYGSTVLEVSVDAYGPKEAVVTIMSYCVQGVEVDEELLTALLELNHARPLGAFSLVDKDIFFSYAMLGRDLQPRTLLSAIAAIADTADEYDDMLVARFGGQTALERIRDTGGRRLRRKAVEEALPS
ncbi:MAG TPA: YbjN domain-containing protein [Thermoanaerobaculia bacterium]|nr:YbjN domain-containing protein [Thermoanaerobaculia bacterium]